MTPGAVESPRAPRWPKAVPVELSRRDAPRAGIFALVRPPAIVFPSSLSTAGPTPPLGVAYLAAAIRHAGHEVQVIDAVGEDIRQLHDYQTEAGEMRRIGLSPAQIVERIRPDAQVIGLSQMFLHEWPTIREIASLARERFPDATIVTGGENATGFWPWIFEDCAAIDAVVVGEGEVTAIALADRVAAGEPLGGLSGVVVRDTDPGHVPDDILPTRIRDLGALPRPAWDLIPLEGYWQEGNFLGFGTGRSMPILATRGCPYRCSFCSSPQMWTTRFTAREPRDVVDEMADLAAEHGIENFDFCDLTAILKRSWAVEFCDALEERQLACTWQLPIGTRSEMLDHDLLSRMWRTGCKNITYSAESGSAHLLEAWDKKVDVEKLLASLRTARQMGFTVHTNLIIGHPEETYRDVLETWKFLIRAAWAGSSTLSPIMFCPYPGSADFRTLLDDGRITVDERFMYSALSRGASGHASYNDRLTTGQLRLIQLAMLVTFYGLSNLRRPERLVQHLRALVYPEHERDVLDQALRVKFRSRLGIRAKKYIETDVATSKPVGPQAA